MLIAPKARKFLMVYSAPGINFMHPGLIWIFIVHPGLSAPGVNLGAIEPLGGIQRFVLYKGIPTESIFKNDDAPTSR